MKQIFQKYPSKSENGVTSTSIYTGCSRIFHEGDKQQNSSRVQVMGIWQISHSNVFRTWLMVSSGVRWPFWWIRSLMVQWVAQGGHFSLMRGVRDVKLWRFVLSTSLFSFTFLLWRETASGLWLLVAVSILWRPNTKYLNQGSQTQIAPWAKWELVR